ncbi:MAG: MSHA biogenesis protein MshP [Agarilytica sp.]
MSPNSRFVFHHAQGFLIPAAAIIVVGVAVLATAITRITSQSSQASVTEGISLQAFYAAESGAYYGMNRLMFDVTDRAISDANCAALSGSTINFSTNGLQSCSTTVTCAVDTVGGDPRSFYSIRSSATCGSGDIFAERIVEVSSFL